MTDPRDIPIPRHEKHRAAMREWRLRLRTYPARIHSGRMTEDEALHEIAVMKAIADDYAGKP